MQHMSKQHLRKLGNDIIKLTKQLEVKEKFI